MSKKKSKLKLVPIGGLQEVGKNMTAYEYDNEIILIDCGMTFPDDEMLGIDVVIWATYFGFDAHADNLQQESQQHVRLCKLCRIDGKGV